MLRGIERTAGKPLHTDMKIETPRHDNLYAVHVSSRTFLFSTVFTHSRSAPVPSTSVLCPPVVAQPSQPRRHLRPLAGIAFRALNVTRIFQSHAIYISSWTPPRANPHLLTRPRRLLLLLKIQVTVYAGPIAWRSHLSMH